MKIIFSLMIFFLFSELTASTGTVDLGKVFCCHPYVLLYYFPQYQAFMKPVTGGLTEASVKAAEKAADQKRVKTESDLTAALTDVRTKIARIRQEIENTEQKLSEARSLAWADQNRKIEGKDTAELVKMNLEFSRNMEKVTSQYDEKKKSLADEMDRLQKQEKEIVSRSFYQEFTTPEETSRIMKRVRDEITAAVKKAAQMSGITLVLNRRAFFRTPVYENAPTIYTRANFDRVKAFSGIIEKDKISRNDLDTFIGNYVQILESDISISGGDEFLNRYLAADETDLTLQAATLLLDGSEINQQAKNAISAYLKKNL